MTPERKIDAIGITALLIVTGIGYMGGVQPIIASHAEAVVLRARVTSIEDQVERSEKKEAALAAEVAEYESVLASGVASMDLSTASNARIAKLAELAQISGVELQTVRPGDRRQGERFEAMPVQVVGRGDLPDTVEFISKLKQVFPDFGVQRIVLERTDEGIARLSLQLNWFTARDGGAGPAGDR
ncbi:MAG: hypothetical protein ACTS22_04985 [Phycisphaerales bacterium]